MRVLVTGGAGYIGSLVVSDLLAHGYEVTVLDNLMHGGEALLGVWSHRSFTFIHGDVGDSNVCKQAIKNMDAVVHLAAIVGDPACVRQPELSQRINFDASLELMKLCRAEGVSRFIFASTCSNYGKMRDADHLVNEDSVLTPVSLYARTKVAMEEVVLDPTQTANLCATSLRFATVFGVSPRMRFDLTVNEFTMELLTKKRLTVYGERFWRPYVHVRDVAKAIRLVLEAPVVMVKNQVFNIGSTSENYQKIHLVELIQPYCPEAIIEYVHKAEDPRDYRVSFEKVLQTLQFKPVYSVKDGIEEVAGLVKQNMIANYYDPKYRN
jgi:nucleoside-diphosphate-sugar epimerase